MPSEHSEPMDAPGVDLGPGDLSTRGLPTARRGYEKKAVDALVASAVDRWTRLHDIHVELLAEVAKSGGADHLARDLGAIGRDVERILEAANAAAERLRRLAVEDAERIGSEAADRAATLLAEAEEQAEEIRRSAWEEGTRLLESAATAADTRLEEAKQEQLRRRAEGERESHRRLAATRKEADDLVRQARFEAEQHLDRVKLLAREIIERATSASGDGDGDAEADEARREAMLEIDKLRVAHTIQDVAVLPEAAGRRRRGRRRDSGDLSDALAAEVGDLHGATDEGGHGAGDADLGDEDGAGVAEAPEIRTLFDALRTTSVDDIRPATPVEPVGPLADRDRRLLGLHNLALREVKRRIAQLQDAVIAGGAAALPAADSVAADLTALLSPVIPQAAAAGAQVAREATGSPGRPDPGPRVAKLVSGMAADLVSQARSAITGDGPEDAPTAVRRVFRRWRTDEAERWVRTVGTAAFHDALLASLSDAGFDRVRGVPSGSPCRDCLGAASAEWNPADRPKGIPPVDIDCRCYFEVARSE